MLAALLLLGGVTLRYFALALLLGVVFGTYSSPFCSVPLILLADDWGRLKRRKK
jgi:preprotein translocase subunit SecF